MTDSRLRGEWLGSLRFDDLTDTAWRVFTAALMWCNENGTDGHVPKRYLRLLHPDGEQQGAFDEIERALLWTSSTTGDYYFHDWEGELGQNSAATVAAYREGARLRSKTYRDKQRSKLERQNSRVTHDATRGDTSDVTRGVREHVGEGIGEGRGLGEDMQSDHAGSVIPLSVRSGAA